MTIVEVIHSNSPQDAQDLGNKITNLGHSVIINDIASANFNNQVAILVVYIEGNIAQAPNLDPLIRTYVNNNTKVVVVQSKSKIDRTIPKILEEVADAIICWDDSFIKRALKGESVFVNAQCNEREKKKIKRYSC